MLLRQAQSGFTYGRTMLSGKVTSDHRGEFTVQGIKLIRGVFSRRCSEEVLRGGAFGVEYSKEDCHDSSMQTHFCVIISIQY